MAFGEFEKHERDVLPDGFSSERLTVWRGHPRGGLNRSWMRRHSRYESYSARILVAVCFSA